MVHSSQAAVLCSLRIKVVAISDAPSKSVYLSEYDLATIMVYEGPVVYKWVSRS